MIYLTWRVVLHAISAVHTAHSLSDVTHFFRSPRTPSYTDFLEANVAPELLLDWSKQQRPEENVVGDGWFMGGGRGGAVSGAGAVAAADVGVDGKMGLWESQLAIGKAALVSGAGEETMEVPEDDNEQDKERPTLDPPTIMAHSHNDEMQSVPLTHALSLGLRSIEADVWLIQGTLYVGHIPHDLSAGKTLKAVYLDPIFELLDAANGNVSISDDAKQGDGGESGKPGWKGVFKEDLEQSLMLQIDVKNHAAQTWDALAELLEPFLARGYLTTFNHTYSPTNGTLTRRPLTIVGTGATPAHLSYAQSPRFIFKDGPLMGLHRPLILPSGEAVPWHPSFSPVASGLLPLRWYIGSPWLHYDEMRGVAAHAHSLGIEIRWWGVLRTGQAIRVAMWSLLKRTGADWLNADDLDDVSRFLRNWEDGGDDDDGDDEGIWMTQSEDTEVTVSN